MFDSLKHWFDSLRDESKLFDHPDNELLHVALASVLYHIIAAGQSAGTRERREFDRILMQEFELDRPQVDHLFAAARASTADLRDDLHTIDFFLKVNPQVRLRFLQSLLRLIDLHGVERAELDVFYAVLHEIFPETRSRAEPPAADDARHQR